MVINIKKNIIKLLFMLTIFLTFNIGEIDSNSDKILYYDRNNLNYIDTFKIYFKDTNSYSLNNSLKKTNIQVISYTIDNKKYYARNIEELIKQYTKNLNNELKVYYDINGVKIDNITAICKVYDLIKLEKLERIY
ncbi:MAG: hypothetical protein MR938_07155 [Tenericutes bacterium]|nr:hypothetical protein [Mycoplasmatota bacterium]